MVACLCNLNGHRTDSLATSVPRTKFASKCSLVCGYSLCADKLKFNLIQSRLSKFPLNFFFSHEQDLPNITSYAPPFCHSRPFTFSFSQSLYVLLLVPLMFQPVFSSCSCPPVILLFVIAIVQT